MIENVAGNRPEDAGMSGDRLARIAPWMEAQVASGRLTGLAVTVMRRDKVVWWACHGKADLARIARNAYLASAAEADLKAKLLAEFDNWCSSFVFQT